jgi:ubiquinol-cytochrome c reductase cytochrome b subunit
MQGYLTEHVAYLSDEGKDQLSKLIAALSAEAKLPSQSESDAASESDGTIEAGRELMSTALAAGEDVESEYSCTDCHKFQDAGELGSAPDLTGYGSEKWLVEFISNPDHERFYESSNDRMPAFAEVTDNPRNNLLSGKEIRLIARWLRGDDKDLNGAK